MEIFNHQVIQKVSILEQGYAQDWGDMLWNCGSYQTFLVKLFTIHKDGKQNKTLRSRGTGFTKHIH
jgi:hypothetical protein